ncbi:MAG: hypothetical protein ABIT10_11940 [Alteraurantiacibacter sp.]
MLPSQRHPDTLPLGYPRHTQSEIEFAAAWLGHVAAGRIGSPPACWPTATLLEARMSPAELATQRANEMAVLGRTPSFPAPVRPRDHVWGR